MGIYYERSNMFDPGKLGRHILYLRRRYKLSMERAALQCDLSLAEWQKLEYGKGKNPRINTMMKIASAFGVPLDMLVGMPKQELRIRAEDNIPSHFKMEPLKFYKYK